MKFLEFNQIIEGINDPHIFKAVFTAGGPGSGKSTVAKLLFGGTGLKFLDVDQFEQLYRKTGRIDPVVGATDTDYERFWQLSQAQKSNYLSGRLGMVIDGTGKDIQRVVQQKEALERFGYDTAMVFVNTSLDKAKENAARREQITGRRVPIDRLISSWEMAQRNLEKFSQIFGNNLIIVDNSGSDPKANIMPSIGKVNRFLTASPDSLEAQRWIQAQTNKGN